MRRTRVVLSTCHLDHDLQNNGPGCGMAPAEVRARLVMLESMRLIAGRQNKTDVKPRRVYTVTGKGRRKAVITKRAHQYVSKW